LSGFVKKAIEFVLRLRGFKGVVFITNFGVFYAENVRSRGKFINGLEGVFTIGKVIKSTIGFDFGVHFILIRELRIFYFGYLGKLLKFQK